MTEPSGPLELFACPHTCPHTQAGFREDSLIGCYLFTGFHHDYLIRHASLPDLHRFCNSNCQVRKSTPASTSRLASAAEIKRWLPWLSGLTTDPKKRAWFAKYIAKYPQYAPYYFTSPPLDSRPTSSPFTDGRQGVPINATWFSKLHLGTLPDPDPSAPQKNTSEPYFKLASSYTEFFSCVDDKSLAYITSYKRRRLEVKALNRTLTTLSEKVVEVTKTEPIEDVISPNNVVDQSAMLCEDTSQPMTQIDPAQEEMLVDHPSEPSHSPKFIQPPLSVSEVQVGSPSVLSAFPSPDVPRSIETPERRSVSQSPVRLNLIPGPCFTFCSKVQSNDLSVGTSLTQQDGCFPSSVAEFDHPATKTSELRSLNLKPDLRLTFRLKAQSSDSSVGTSPPQQDECFPSTVARLDHPVPCINATEAEEPPMSLEIYACPHTCPHTLTGFREDSLTGCYLFTGFDRLYVSRHASLQAIHSFCSSKCYVQAVAPNATSRLASDAEIKRWLPWLSGLTTDPNKRKWFEEYIAKHPEYASYYFTSPPLGLQPQCSPFTDGRTDVPVNSQWYRCRGTLPNPDPPPPQRLVLSRAASYTEFFDGLVQSRKSSTNRSLTPAKTPEFYRLREPRVETLFTSVPFPSAVQHSSTLELQAACLAASPRRSKSPQCPHSPSVGASPPPQYSLVAEKEYLFATLAALLVNPPPAPDPPRNAAEFNAIHSHYNVEQFVKNIQDGSLRESGFYPHMVGASSL